MSYYTLAPSRVSHRIVDSVIYDRDEETGEQKAISTTEAADLTDDQASKLRSQGYELVEASVPSDDEVSDQEVSQPVGTDVAGMSPVVEQTPYGVGLSQIGEQEVEEQDAEEESPEGG